MVLPEEIGDAAQDADEADVARVKAWLDSGGDINDGDEYNYTLLHCCAIGTREDSEVTDAHVSLAVRGLAQRGKLAVQLAITARAARENPALNFIARLGDNGVCWHILTYWRPAE